METIVILNWNIRELSTKWYRVYEVGNCRLNWRGRLNLCGLNGSHRIKLVLYVSFASALVKFNCLHKSGNRWKGVGERLCKKRRIWMRVSLRVDFSQQIRLIKLSGAKKFVRWEKRAARDRNENFPTSNVEEEHFIMNAWTEHSTKSYVVRFASFTQRRASEEGEDYLKISDAAVMRQSNSVFVLSHQTCSLINSDERERVIYGGSFRYTSYISLTLWPASRRFHFAGRKTVNTYRRRRV